MDPAGLFLCSVSQKLLEAMLAHQGKKEEEAKTAPVLTSCIMQTKCFKVLDTDYRTFLCRTLRVLRFQAIKDIFKEHASN